MKESNCSAQFIMNAMNFYSGRGYAPVSVPYVIDVDVNAMTCPEYCAAPRHQKVGPNAGVYSGSAEQGFLQLMKDRAIGQGKYMAITPCVRDEWCDETHFLTFLKVELIHIIKEPSYKAAEAMMSDAYDFFMKSVGNTRSEVLELVNFDNLNYEHDILLNGFEIGSYGIRKGYNGETYVYGTGIAEPRFSYAYART
jgi:aspartyl-tRNA synthetase